jgi:hypothetical protein
MDVNLQPQATAVLISSIILLGGWVEIGEDLDAAKKGRNCVPARNRSLILGLSSP